MKISQIASLYKMRISLDIFEMTKISFNTLFNADDLTNEDIIYTFDET